MGDFGVHRVRIGDWTSSPIKSIASDSFSTKVAVGRLDGDIEICDAASKWYCQARVSGQSEFQLQGLLWSAVKAEQGRLFGISLRGFLFEVDLATLRIKNIRDSYGGAAWCVAGSPRSATIAVGCEDGAVRLYNYDGDGTTLEYHKTLPTSGSRIVSIAYHPIEPLLFIGCSDGTVRCLEETSGRVKFRMTGNVLKGGVTPIIWSLLVLKDSTVITGDNKGHVQVWDGINGVMIDAYHPQNTDVLALVANKDESCFFASGVDGKVSCFQKTLKLAKTEEELKKEAELAEQGDLQLSAPSDNNWVYSHSHRAHTHDVYTLSICFTPPDNNRAVSTKDSKGTSNVDSSTGHWILLSGGLDTKMCTYSATDFGKVRPSWIPSVPANTLINHSAKHDVLTMRHRQHVDIWHVQRSATESNDNQACNLLMRLQTKGDEHNHVSALAPNGKYLAVGSANGVRFWSIYQNIPKTSVMSSSGEQPTTDKKNKKAKGKASTAVEPVVVSESNSTSTFDVKIPVELKSVSLPKALTSTKLAYQALQFSPDSTQLAVYESSKGSLSVYDIHVDDTDSTDQYIDISLSYVIDNTTEIPSSSSAESVGHLNKLSQAVKSIRFSDDGKFIAVSSCSREVYVFDTVNKRLHWKLPKAVTNVSDIQFVHNPKANDNSNVLMVLTANNTFMLFDVNALKLHVWSVTNSDKIPTYVRQLPGSLSGISVDSSDGNRVILYGQGCCVLIKLNEKIPSAPKVVTQTTTALMQKSLAKKRKYQSEEDSNSNNKSKKSDEVTNFVVINIYRNLLHIGCVDNNQLVVVENPWIRTAEQMPDTISRKRYGT